MNFSKVLEARYYVSDSTRTIAEYKWRFVRRNFKTGRFERVERVMRARTYQDDNGLYFPFEGVKKYLDTDKIVTRY